jgi:hypothetical protein
VDLIRFVDGITESPGVRLDLNDESPWASLSEHAELHPPPLKDAWTGSLLVDGERQVAAVHGNRTLRFRLEVIGTDSDVVAGHLQDLWREVDRPRNILMWQPEGAAFPVFFRTFRSAANAVAEYPGSAGRLATVDVRIEAEPYAYGLRETLPQVTLYADPAEGGTLNANPFFEVTEAPWTASGGTAVRSTAQAHEGTASLLLTPNGVATQVYAESEHVPAVAGAAYRVSAWVRCNVTRTAAVSINWFDASSTYLSTSSMAATSVTALTWALLDYTATAPVGAAYASMTAIMGSTPLAAHLLYIDEARLRAVGSTGAAHLTVTGVRGDVETPLYFRVEQANVGDFRQSVIGVRRRGTPSLAPYLLQAESMTLGTGAALGASYDAAMSGAGQNYVRITFGVTSLSSRLSVLSWPPAGVDARGTYRLFIRVRPSAPADVFRIRATLSGADGEVVTAALGPATTADYVDLGLLQLPPGADPVTDGYSGTELSVESTGLTISAARDSGSGTLDIDHVLLVPADDALAVINWPVDSTATAFVLDSERVMVYGVGAAGAVRAVFSQASIAGGLPLVSPGATNRVVWIPDTGALQSDAVNRLAQSIKVTPYYWPRYLRAAEVGS